MKLTDQIVAMDAILRDLFRHGGPQRASAPRMTSAVADARTYAKLGVPARQLVTSTSTGSTACLKREQRRLIKTWREN